MEREKKEERVEVEEKDMKGRRVEAGRRLVDVEREQKEMVKG